MSLFRSSLFSSSSLGARTLGRQPTRLSGVASSTRSMSILDKVFDKAKETKDQVASAVSTEDPAPSNAEQLTAHATSENPSEAGLGKGENNLSSRGTAYEEAGGRGSAQKGIQVEEMTEGQDVVAEGAKDKPSKQ